MSIHARHDRQHPGIQFTIIRLILDNCRLLRRVPMLMTLGRSRKPAFPEPEEMNPGFLQNAYLYERTQMLTRPDLTVATVSEWCMILNQQIHNDDRHNCTVTVATCPGHPLLTFPENDETVDLERSDPAGQSSPRRGRNLHGYGINDWLDDQTEM